MTAAKLPWVQNKVGKISIKKMKTLSKKNRNKKKGQGVIEFAFVSFIFLNLFLLTLNGILAFSVHQYISFATFMAARAYQASDSTVQDQSQNAQDTIKSYFNLPGIRKEMARIKSIEIPDGSRPTKHGYKVPEPGAQIRVVFEVPLFQFPLGPASRDYGWITMESISYLGREPTVRECGTFFEAFWKYYGGGGDTWKGMDDNNC